jgi:phosphatidate cytidylyltransferase
MALSELKTRVITGAVFGFVLIGGILLSEYALAAIALFVMFVGMWEFVNLLKPLRILPNKLFLYLGGLVVFLGAIAFTLAEIGAGASMDEVRLAFLCAIAFSTCLFLWELFRAEKKAIENIATTFLGIFYLALPMGLLLSVAVSSAGEYSPWQVLFFFFFMWASDTGAYFSGRAFGKHKLLERLSPKKTIEGFLGGMITAMLVGYAASFVFDFGAVWAWVLTGGVLAITGTAADLFESMLKRQAGIKDSGKILPGHGGILDRFDSTFVSIPVYYLLLSYLLN